MSLIGALLGPAHLSLLDEDGRPLGEAASPIYAAGECPVHEAPRTFGDCRDAHGLPSNIAALAQLRASWPQLLATLCDWFRTEPPTVARMLRRVHHATARARFRAACGLPIRRFDAALYKVCLGFGHLLRVQLLREVLDADAPPPPADALMDWLDAEPWLVGDHQVCAGTRKQIAAVWEALSRTAFDTGAHSPSAGRVFGEALVELGALAGAAALAARATVRHADEEDAGPSARFAFAESVPAHCEDVRQVLPSPLHVSLLYGAEALPASLRGFLESLPADGDLPTIDRQLLAHARDPANRLLRACGRPPIPEGHPRDVFVRACDANAPLPGSALPGSTQER